MQEYKGFLIDGAAKMVHPFYPESYPSGTVYKYGRGSSIVEVERFEIPDFKMKEILAECSPSSAFASSGSNRSSRSLYFSRRRRRSVGLR